MTAPATPKRLVEYSTLQFPENALRLDDIADQEVTIVSGHTGPGKFGEYAVLEILDTDQNPITIVTSGMLVVEALKNAIVANLFPLAAKFTRTGRAWKIE